MASNSGAATGGFQEEYMNLRKQVAELKLQQKETSRVATRTKEALELQEAKEAMADKVAHYEARIEGMQKHIREVTDRSSKMRGQYEREKTALSTKVDKLALRLESQAGAHKAEKEALVKSLEQEKERSSRLLAQTQEQQEEELRAREAVLRKEYAAEKDALGSEADRLKEAHKRDIEEAAAREQSWQERLEETQQARDRAIHDAEALRQQLKKAQQQIGLLQSSISQCQEGWEGEKNRLLRSADDLRAQMDETERAWRGRLLQAQMEAQEQLEEYRCNKASDLELIHSKLKGVVASRDATIRQLRSELHETQVQLSKLQGLLEHRSRAEGGPGSPA
eukprot:CAMPEP_0117671086 /NCGR_PEP_ID=MMETSP0804-20121206/13132_1 /TAXON_ID=1074897 /ORGANISM="Tetraselmis astigmatica, Strain CCMP880" /LENGTH=336 /DNA_ID=CAMNT_0005479495 /DNA_START=166 /DNA_END=1173 /DNA_ORIENTATION=+